MRLFLLLCFSLVHSLSFAAGKVVFMKGKVTLNGKALSKSSVVNVEDTLKTEAKSLVVVKFSEGSTLKLNEKSQVKIGKQKNKEKNKSVFLLLKGSSFFELDPKVKGDLRVKTRRASMGVRGTQFFVMNGKKDDFMCVREGSVWIMGKERKKVLVKEGQGVVVGKKKVSDPSFLPWTKGLNWKLDPSEGDLVNKVQVNELYKNPLDQDYD